jgi:uncharacterized protein YllA (UPF0747 family)
MNIYIEILNQKALKLLHDLEELNLIKVIEEENGHSKTIEKKEDKLSKKFAGKLKLSKEEYKKFHKYLKNIRKEWESRNI